MKAFLIFLLVIGACHCQYQCSNRDDIAKIIETPPSDRPIDELVYAAEKHAYALNEIASQYGPEDYPKDPIPIQCHAAILGNIFGDIEPHVDDDKWEMSESTLRQYDELEKSFADDGTVARRKRGIFGFFKKVVKGIVKIAQTIAKVVQVIKKVVSFVLTVISIIKDIKAIFGLFG